MNEAVRNKLLRRADWRFLLPNPWPTKSVCFANGQLGEAVSLISGRLAAAQAGPTGDCDLAVAIDPDHETLQAAWASLDSRGSCYTEWYSPLTGGPTGVRRRLEAVGFKDVICYWCGRPGPRAAPQYWLPLEAPGALRYFMTSRAPGGSVLHRIGRIILQVAWLLFYRVGRIFPICAIALKPAFHHTRNVQSTARAMPWASSPSQDISSVTSDFLGTIRNQWKHWGFGPTPDNLSLLMLTGGPVSASKVVALVFAEPDHHPRLAVKMPRVPEAVPMLTNEATALRIIQLLRPGGMRGAPRVLFCQERAGLLTVGETALTGRFLSSLIRRNSFRDLALKATDWLSELAGRTEPSSPAIWWDRLVEPVLTDFAESFGPVIDRGMFQDTRDIVAALGALPLVCEHRDFAPWNTLLTPRGELAVLDWEAAEPQGLPALDLIYFLTHLAFFLGAGSSSLRESYRATLEPSTLTGRVVSECLSRYVSQTGLDGSAIRPLRLLAWLLHSRSDYQQFVADSGGRPAPEVLRRSGFVGLWEEELRHQAAARYR